MKSKKIKRILLFLLLISVLYHLFISSIHQWKHHLKGNTKGENPSHHGNTTSIVPGVHHHLPRHLKGKRLPFDHIYEPREVGFPEDFKTPTIQHKTKTILLWTKWNSLRKTINYYFLQPGNKTFLKHNCPNSNCIATFKRKYLHKVDAVLFHLIDTNATDLPTVRNPKQIWVLYNMEPPWQVNKHKTSELNLLNNMFNWTLSYRYNSDIVAKYGFISPSNSIQLRNFNSILNKKPKNVVWFVSDCTTDSRREDYVKELKKYIDVDIYGKCGDHKCYPSQSSSCYSGVLKHYKFYISFENAICKDYVTEKFFNVFNYDIVPIVFGAANYSMLAPKGSFIHAADYPQPRLLAKTLIEIASNESVYTEFLKKKSSFQAYLDPWMCRLCNELHSSVKTSVLKNVKKWFFEEAQCKKWDNESQTYVNNTM